MESENIEKRAHFRHSFYGAVNIFVEATKPGIENSVCIVHVICDVIFEV